VSEIQHGTESELKTELDLKIELEPESSFPQKSELEQELEFTQGQEQELKSELQHDPELDLENQQGPEQDQKPELQRELEPEQLKLEPDLQQSSGHTQEPELQQVLECKPTVETLQDLEPILDTERSTEQQEISSLKKQALELLPCAVLHEGVPYFSSQPQPKEIPIVQIGKFHYVSKSCPTPY